MRHEYILAAIQKYNVYSIICYHGDIIIIYDWIMSSSLNFFCEF